MKLINIKDELPPPNDLVFVLCKDGSVTMSRYVSNDFPHDCIFWSKIVLEYRGYKIEKETEPWAIKIFMCYRYYIDGERIRNEETVQDCISAIDEEIEEIKNKARNILK